MSPQDTPTPEQDPRPQSQRQITVSVPEDRVEQFEAFYERFKAMAEHGGRHGRGPGRRGRGRRGAHRRHHIRAAMFHLAMAEHAPGPHGGPCGHHHHHGDDADDATPAGATTL